MGLLMFEWLQEPAAEAVLTAEILTGRLLWSLVFGLVIAVVYRATQRREASMSVILTTTLALLTMLVAMTALVIGNNVARAFSLVGALSIVRFRTVVEDTRDTAFVIFAVVIGMAVGAGHLLVCFIGLPLVSLVAWGMNFWSRSNEPRGLPQKLEVRVGTGLSEPQQTLGKLLAPFVTEARLSSIITARQGAALDLQYVIRLRDAGQMLPLVQAVHKLEGVHQVELKEL